MLHEPALEVAMGSACGETLAPSLLSAHTRVQRLLLSCCNCCGHYKALTPVCFLPVLPLPFVSTLHCFLFCEDFYYDTQPAMFGLI